MKESEWGARTLRKERGSEGIAVYSKRGVVILSRGGLYAGWAGIDSHRLWIQRRQGGNATGQTWFGRSTSLPEAEWDCSLAVTSWVLSRAGQAFPPITLVASNHHSMVTEE